METTKKFRQGPLLFLFIYLSILGNRFFLEPVDAAAAAAHSSERKSNEFTPPADSADKIIGEDDDDENTTGRLRVIRGVFAGRLVSNTTSCDSMQVDKFVSWGNGVCMGRYKETVCCSGLCLPSELKPYHHYYLEAKYTPFDEVFLCSSQPSTEVTLVTLDCPDGFDPVKVEVALGQSCVCKKSSLEEFLATIDP